MALMISVIMVLGIASSLLSTLRLLREREVIGVSWTQPLWLAAALPLASGLLFVGGLVTAGFLCFLLSLQQLLYVGLMAQVRRELALVDSRTDGYLETFSGALIDPLEPDPSLINIDDVAQGLANESRYHGQSRKFYSVAEHSVLLADHAEQAGRSPEDCLAILLHDKAEGLLKDIARPLKRRIRDWDRIERRMDDACADALGVPRGKAAWIDELDTRIVKDERMHAMNQSGNSWKCDGLAPLGVVVQLWTPDRAAYEFRGRYERYSNMIAARGSAA